MLNISNGGSIAITRGDTATIEVTVADAQTGAPREFEDGDTLTMTVRKTVDTATASLTKTATGSGTLSIAHADTASMAFGNYVYDVQLDTEDGGTYTVVGPCKFEVLPEVTR